MQGTAISHPLDTLPALSGLVQLRTGASYAVDSASLAMALMAGPSQAGAWSAVIGAADFGMEAAAGLGVDLDRTVVVPDPGEEWLYVAAAMIDVVTVVLIKPPGQVRESQAAKLTARLRQRDAMLIAWGDWPRSDARLQICESVWTGLGRGHGHLSGRRVLVAAGRNGSPSRQARLWLPDSEQRVRLVESAAELSALPGSRQLQVG
jgi:hypothetical protein